MAHRTSRIPFKIGYAVARLGGGAVIKSWQKEKGAADFIGLTWSPDVAVEGCVVRAQLAQFSRGRAQCNRKPSNPVEGRSEPTPMPFQFRNFG